MAHRLFGYLLPQVTDEAEETKRRLAYADWLVTQIPAEEFKAVDRILYHYIAYTSKLNSILKRDHLENLMSGTLKTFLLKERIQVEGTEDMSYQDRTQIDTIVAKTRAAVLLHYDMLQSETDYFVEDFAITMATFFQEQKKFHLISMYQTGFEMVNSVQKDQSGIDDAYMFTQDRLGDIEAIYDESKLEILSEDTVGDDEGKFRYVTKTGLPEIDRDTNGLYTRQLWGLEGAPGAGKTRFALSLFVYRTLVIEKKNVIFFALEQTKAEIKAMLTSMHVFALFQEQISDSMILKELVTDEEVLRHIKIAESDLFDSGVYGKLHIVDTELYVNDMERQFRSLQRLKGPFDLWVIDYMYMLQAKDEKFKARLLQMEIIHVGYKKFKYFCRKMDVAGLAVNQLNREGVEATKKDQDVDATMAAGGLEVYRNTDYNLVIGATDEMEAQNKRRIQTPKRRSSKGISKFLVSVNMAICYIKSIGGKL